MPIQEAASVLFREDSRETPWLFFQWLHILDLDHKDITRLRGFDFKGSSQVVDLSEVDVAHVVSGVVVANLPASPVDAFDLDSFTWFDSAVPSKVSILIATGASLKMYTGLSGCHRF
jgi:hypothetical protein